MQAVESGTARARDLNDLAEAAGFMVRSRLLRAQADGGGGGDGPAPARAVGRLRASGRADSVPPGGSSRDPFHPGSPERAVIEATLA
jgi:hypothetical protein